MTQIILEAEIQLEQSGQRLDQALADLFPEYSRSRLKTWIETDLVTLNGQITTIPRTKVFGGEKIVISADIEDETHFEPENLPLNIVYEDEHILIINKLKDFVVHPGAGNKSGTVLNALLYHYPSVAEVPRAGIVHRLDKDTTGLMVVAKTIPAQTKLVRALQKRQITREYEAIACGIMTKGGAVDEPIARHPTKRTHMAVHPLGKPAVTHYRIMENFRNYTRLRLRLETGRTHQIRVHMAYIGHPVAGDPLYAPKKTLKGQGQFLHAKTLGFTHPKTGELMQFTTEVPVIFQEVLDHLHHL